MDVKSFGKVIFDVSIGGHMLGYEFKTCIRREMELYYFMEQELEGQKLSTRSEVFPESLLSFLYWDIEYLRPAFQELAARIRKVIDEKDHAAADKAYELLQGLSNYHVYFELLRLDWKYRLDRAWYTGYEFPANFLQVYRIEEMPDRLADLQKRGLALIKNVLDTDTPKVSVDEKMTAYYLAAEQNGEDVFRFRPQKMRFEMLYQETFAEILCPDTVYDLIDYQLRECIKRGIKMRVCKNCEKYFAVTGHGNTEYCSRVFDSKGRTCKEIGAVTQWTKSKSADLLFKEYRREYKRRFAWIKSGRIEQEDFYTWSEEAREKKAECEAGKISFEEFSEWLSNS